MVPTFNSQILIYQDVSLSQSVKSAKSGYFLHSEKGSRKLNRPARKRGGKAAKRGLSDEHVPVLIARDRNKATTD